MSPIPNPKWNDPEHRKRTSLNARARWTATQRLIELHRDEYDHIHAEERAALGLDPNLQTVRSLKAQIRRLEAELAAKPP